MPARSVTPALQTGKFKKFDFFEHLILFRISIFEFRILAPDVFVC